MAEAIILKVFGDDPYNKNARSELIRRAERATVAMSEIKEMRFTGVNITRDGMQIISNEKYPTKIDALQKSIEEAEKIESKLNHENDTKNEKQNIASENN